MTRKSKSHLDVKQFNVFYDDTLLHNYRTLCCSVAAGDSSFCCPLRPIRCGHEGFGVSKVKKTIMQQQPYDMQTDLITYHYANALITSGQLILYVNISSIKLYLYNQWYHRSLDSRWEYELSYILTLWLCIIGIIDSFYSRVII